MSRPDPPPRAVIDADIIFSRVLHDLMGRVGRRLGLLEIVWSQEPLAEAILEEQPQAVLELLELQASTWAGGRPIAQLLDALERAGAATVAKRARRLLAG